MKVVPLWDMVKAAYAIRNAVAHEGFFDSARAATGDRYERLASDSFESGFPDILGFVRTQAELVLAREA